MKKLHGILLTAAALMCLAGCGGQEVPVTEPTLPLPLWAQDEEDRPTQPDIEETEGIALPDDIQETVSELPEEYPEENTEAPTTAATEETKAPAVSTDYDMEEKFSPVEPETVYAKKSVNIRTAGNINSGSLGRLGEGKTVTRVGISEDGWSAVLYNDQLCYISSDYLTTQEVEPTENPNVPSEQEVDDMVYTVDDVNMREGPGFDRAVLCRVPEFVEIHRTGIVSSGWCRVTYKDQEGFISTGYLAEKHPNQSEPIQEEEVDDEVYTTREVNFRKFPGTKKAIIGRIPQGTKVHRIAITEDGWGKVTYEGQTGYVSGDFLSTEIPAEG